MEARVFEFEKAVVSVKRICVNPCAEDEYSVRIEPNNGAEVIETTTLAGIFEPDEHIARRVYDNVEF